jgi:hypothetical protein
VSATKVVLIILALIAVLFVVLVLIPPRVKTTENADSFASGKHASLDSVNSILAPFAPKLSAKALQPPLQAFDLSLTPSYKITILPDTSQKFRRAEFVAFPSKHCALVTYTPSDSSGLDKGKPQDSEHSGSSDHPDRFSFTFLSGGGILKIDRSSPATPARCTLVLQVAK